MKYWCISIYVLFTLSGFSQKSKPVIPPGTIKINDTLYADKTEIANIHWREYYWWLSRFDFVNADKALPDTLVWRDSVRYNESIVDYYFRHPGFNNYPVVGISHEQAIEFCKWRTLAANYVRYCKETGITPKANYINEQFPIKFYYRLPTKQEWEMLAAGEKEILNFPYGFDSTYKQWRKVYKRIFNCLYPGDESTDSIPPNKSFYTTEAKSFYANTYSLYNTIGNLAEMISEKGIAKGGSFVHTLEECKITNSQLYTKPERWLGFRCVAVLIK